MPARRLSVVITETAQRNIQKIWSDLARDAGARVADDLYSRIRKRIDELPDFPESWPSRAHVRPHYRIIPASS